MAGTGDRGAHHARPRTVPPDPQVIEFLADAPLFFQPWWLELTAPGEWDYVVVKRGESIAAVLPYVAKVRCGWRVIEMPPYTPFLGPWLRKSTAKYANRLGEEKDLMTELIAGLPEFAIFRQTFHPGITSWLPFHWKGFQQTTLYTYRIEDTRDLEKLWGETRDNIRTDVRKARKAVTIEETDDFSHVIRMQHLTLQRQGLEISHTDESMRNFGATCARNGAGKIFIARDPEGRVHAAVYLLIDATTVYYYTGGGDPELRNSGAASLLVWKAIETASALGKKFDFEGSVLEPVERFFRSFGAVQTPFFEISKVNSRTAAAAKWLLGTAKAKMRGRLRPGEG